MIKSFTLGGIVSSMMGLAVGEKKIYGAPERDVENIEIPGRNGDALYDNGRFKNIHIEYRCYIIPQENLSVACKRVKAWLCKSSAYRILKDTYDPYYFRMASYKSAYDIEEWAREIGYAPILFDCKPQRFSNAGQITQTIDTGDAIYNPEAFTALPLIRAYGTGEAVLTVGSCEIEIAAIDEYIDIDSDIQDAFKGATNLNGEITLSGGEFPALTPGRNAVSWTGGITSVEIKPRWWTI